MTQENIKNGIVGEATNLPIPDRVAGVVHVKDLLEHLDDKQLSELANEARRVLIENGKLIVTEENHRTGFPVYEKPFVVTKIKLNPVFAKEMFEPILPGENYSQMVTRLKDKYGESVTVGLPYFVRSRNEIVTKLAEYGFRCEKTFKWKANSNERDPMKSHTPRNILIFSQKV